MNFKLSLLLWLFCSLLIGMNLLWTKITTLFGISVSVWIFMVPLTFLITDIVEEVHGKSVSRQFLKIWVICLFVMSLYTLLFVALEPNPKYASNAEYTLIFGQSMRIIVASIVAFALGQMHDIWAFSFWKKKTDWKYLWLRNNASTIVSQAIDTLVFMMIAFYMVTPKFTFEFILQLAIPYYLFKIAFAALDTPLVYAGVKWLREEIKEVV